MLKIFKSLLASSSYFFALLASNGRRSLGRMSIGMQCWNNCPVVFVLRKLTSRISDALAW